MPCKNKYKCPSVSTRILDLPRLPAGVKFDPFDQDILEHLEAKVCSDFHKLHPLIDKLIPSLEGENRICCTHPKKLPRVGKDGTRNVFITCKIWVKLKVEMNYAIFRLGWALLDDLYGSDRPDNHKRLGGPKDMNEIGGPDKPNESIRPNDLMSHADPKTRTDQAEPMTKTGQAAQRPERVRQAQKPEQA
ncbi:hypothetical protein DEO72_LG8g1476 [Vigna unguiculata]|uniref:NAC domain-containing protein n=1 Tax=Vigna unguiculata TaxID=3917 RepID=A0A4D6MS61_VIGUN|nr:hypothetical protein DEO72_LG8g1476 [Vigna unguiculata]